MSSMGNAVSLEALEAKGVTRGSAGADGAVAYGRDAYGRTASGKSAWQLDTFYGRLAELSGGPASASLTLAFSLVLQAQKCAEPVAWIHERGSAFFPPDVAATGVDLETLAIVRLSKAQLAPRAADQLIRSGAFGLVVLDLGARVHVPMAVQTRLVGLARKHATAVLCLTQKASDEPSLGSLVSFHAQAMREYRTQAMREHRTQAMREHRTQAMREYRTQAMREYRTQAMREHRTQAMRSDSIDAVRSVPQGGGYGLNVRVLKDKQCGVGWRHQEVCGGVDGLY